MPSLPALAETRLALVITNQNYTQVGARLTNTYRDGDLVKEALDKVGFKVWVVRDTANGGALLQAIGDHVQRLVDAGPEAVGFLYYTGHGAADRPDGANYLIPTGAPLTYASQLPLMAVRLDEITATLANAGKINFVVFDACRNVPLQRAAKDATFKGWAPVREQRGLLVAYATEPGNVAVDQSIYAKALAEEIVKPGIEASQAFRAVTRRVLKETQDKQSPEYLDKRLYDFHFASAVSVTPEPVEEARLAREAAKAAEEQRVAAIKAAEEATKAADDAIAQKRDTEKHSGPAKIAALPKIDRPYGADQFDGAWKLDRKSTNCIRNWTFNFQVTNGTISGATPFGKITGSVSASGQMKLSHIGNNGIPLSYSGSLRGDSGSGRFFKTGSCNGTFTATKL